MPIIVRFTTFKKRDPFRSATGGAADRPYFRITFHPQQAAAGQKNSVNGINAGRRIHPGYRYMDLLAVAQCSELFKFLKFLQ